MASPIKNLVDATGLTKANLHKTTVNMLRYFLLRRNNGMRVSVATYQFVPRFSIVRVAINPNSISNSSKYYLRKRIRGVVFKTFPSGYHESVKARPSEGQIYPRKRIKNY